MTLSGPFHDPEHDDDPSLSDGMFATEPSVSCWEQYHENSKTTPYDRFLNASDVVSHVHSLDESLDYRQSESITLPDVAGMLSVSLEQAILQRTSARAFTGSPIQLCELAALLRFSYGVNPGTSRADYPRRFRVVPSGGALYPLELYCLVNNCTGLDRGVYHFRACDGVLRRRPAGDSDIALRAFVQPDLIQQAAVVIIVTAFFERSTFKYGERAYRFVLLEAGHVGQNLALTAASLNIGAVCLGGYFDRALDDHLGLDGSTQSIVYAVAAGR